MSNSNRDTTNNTDWQWFDDALSSWLTTDDIDEFRAAITAAMDDKVREGRIDELNRLPLTGGGPFTFNWAAISKRIDELRKVR